jgi:hypothetical protein
MFLALRDLMFQLAAGISIAIFAFLTPAHAQTETEVFEVYGVKYSVPTWPTDHSIVETFRGLNPILQDEIQTERRLLIRKFLSALTITSPIARIKEHFNPPTNDVWLDESRMLSEHGYFADRNPTIGVGAFKTVIEKGMVLLNDRIWATARIRGDPNHYKGKMQIFFFNIGGGATNFVEVKGVKVPTSELILRSFVAFTFYDHVSERWRTKFYFHRQSVDREKAVQLFFGGEVGYRALQVYSLDPGLDPKGEFISFPGTPVAIEGPRMAGYGINLSMNLVTDSLVFLAAYFPGARVALGTLAAAAQVISKVGIVQTTFKNEYLGELPSILKWLEKKIGIRPDNWFENEGHVSLNISRVSGGRCEPVLQH